MESILFLTHTQADGTLPKVALEALSAALAIAKGTKATQFMVGLVGKDVQAAANTLGACDAQKYFAVSGDDFSNSRYSTDVLAFEAIAKASGATLIIAPGTSRASRALPGVAQRLNGRLDSHVSAIDTATGSVQIQRWYYRQRMLASLSRTQRPWILLVDSGIFPAFQGDSASITLQNLPVQVSDTQRRTKVEGIKAPSSDAQTIRPEAKLLFVAGAGWAKKQPDGQPHVKEAEQLILGFLGRSKASLGGSKSLVDQSGEGHEIITFMSHLNQVGQTGATPRHPKGLATCCHGEEPHVVGWRFINERRAVNLDPNCGWAQGKADVLYVADAFKVVAKLNEILKS